MYMCVCLCMYVFVYTHTHSHTHFPRPPPADHGAFLENHYYRTEHLKMYEHSLFLNSCGLAEDLLNYLDQHCEGLHTKFKTLKPPLTYL